MSMFVLPACMYMCHEYLVSPGVEEVSGFPETEVTDGGGPRVVAGNQSQVLCKDT